MLVYNRNIIFILELLLLTLLSSIDAYVTEKFNLIACQGKIVTQKPCLNTEAVYKIQSITVFTSDDVDQILNSSSTERGCLRASKCVRKIHNNADTALSPDYLYLYNWLFNQCNGRPTCQENGTMPEWWAMTNDDKSCGEKEVEGSLHFAGVLMDVQCRAGESIATVTAQHETTPKTKPTTPTTTTAFPVYVPLYVPKLIGREKIILGVAIGLALAILIVLLVVLYCCESYRNHKKFAKLLQMLGAPQAQDDAFDDFEDYGKSDAWRDETNNFDALGEYTGVKPDEFLTLDKRAMESSGQIMYDTHMGTMTIGRQNSCSTLSRNGGVCTTPSGFQPSINYAYSEKLDYNTAENLDLERRMAETLKEQLEYEEHTSYH